MIDMLKSAILTIILTTLFLTVSVLAMIAFGCTLDTSPDTDIYIEGDRSSSVTGSGVGAVTDEGPAVTPWGDRQFRLGPGKSFAFTGGTVMVLWCRPNSTCSGEGSNRTAEGIPQPPSDWIADRYAYFRLVGSREVNAGKAGSFLVDSQVIQHVF